MLFWPFLPVFPLQAAEEVIHFWCDELTTEDWRLGEENLKIQRNSYGVIVHLMGYSQMDGL